MEGGGEKGNVCVEKVCARPGWGVLLEGCIKSSDLPICLCSSSFLSPSIFNSLSTYFSLVPAASSQSSLCFCLHIFSFQEDTERGGEKQRQREKE